MFFSFNNEKKALGSVSGLILGAMAGVVHFLAVEAVKKRWKIDGSLDTLIFTGLALQLVTDGSRSGGGCAW